MEGSGVGVFGAERDVVCWIWLAFSLPFARPSEPNHDVRTGDSWLGNGTCAGGSND